MRADKFFAEKFGSRTKAAEAIEKGFVLVNGKSISPKYEVSEKDCVEFIEPKEYFVSNGGYKLSKALDEFSFSPENMIFADIGASTGGFTDCLLQRGAKKVYAVDVGESLLHESLQNDTRIIRMENVNARYLVKADFPEEIDGIVADVSFISLKYILPVLKEVVAKDGNIFVLIKPQFECEKKNIGKSGIVHTSAHGKIVEKVLGYCADVGLAPISITNAPIRKGKNIEYVLWLTSKEQGFQKESSILKKVTEIVQNNARKNLDAER